MRRLDTDIDWQPEVSSAENEVAVWASETFEYARITRRGGCSTEVFLYARERSKSDAVLALGAFDTPEQADFFTALHRDNPLFVPALICAVEWPVTAGSTLVYEGVYRVGMKCYRVTQPDEASWSVEYIEGYRTELLGEAGSAVDACLLVYNHFDGRLRGCKLC